MSTVMIADDNRVFREGLSELLTENDYEVCEAEDGEQAVQVYRSSRPDVVLMDVTMPRKDGLQALAEICQFDPEAKVIMLTALNQESVMIKAAQLGAKDFLIKLVALDQLIATLQRALGCGIPRGRDRVAAAPAPCPHSSSGWRLRHSRRAS